MGEHADDQLFHFAVWQNCEHGWSQSLYRLLFGGDGCRACAAVSFGLKLIRCFERGLKFE